MKKVKILLFAILISVGCLLLVPSGKAQASSDSILKKWARINAYECIVDNKLLHSPVSPKKDNGNMRTSPVLDLVTSYSTNWVSTPSYGFGGTTPGSSVACRYVIDGPSNKYNGMTNLLAYGGRLDLSGIRWDDSPSKVEELLTLLDYVGEETEGGGGRFSIVANRRVETCQTSLWSSYCSDDDKGTEVSTVGITVTRQDDGTLLYKRDSGNLWGDLKVSFKDHNIILETASGFGCTGGGKLEEPLQGDLNVMYDNLSEKLTNTTWKVTCSAAGGSDTIPISYTSTTNYTFGVSDKVIDSSEMSQYVINDPLITVAKKVSLNLTGDTLRGFTNTEKYELYDFYLNKAIAMGGAIANRKTCNPTSTANLQPVKLLDTSDNTFKTCYVNLGTLDTENTKVNVPNDTYTKIIEISIADVISRLDRLNTSDINISEITGVASSDDPYDNPLPGDPDDPGESVGITDGCFNSSGALGWIICPVMRIVGEAVNGIYGIVEKNYLSINSDVVESDGLTEAWNYFQTFANIIFAILLIIVILAQVTGFGISNYGIKKILPRLVITAILVNLSLIMCIIAADLSNITGAGFNEMLRGIKVDTLTWQDINAGTFFLDTITSIGVVGIPIAIAGAAVKITIQDGGWDVLIMPLLIGAIVAFFAILFFYVLLAVRKAAIVLLIAISPIAVVCYVLPNTQKLFSRWLKMFSTLLLVYPICGILMGGGNFASRLLLVTAGDAGFVYYLVCMLLSVVPFFFIPTLLKNSMSALGSIGAKIANMGSRWSNMATGALRRSRWAQEHQQRVARNIDMNRNNRLQNRWKPKLDELRKRREEQGDKFSRKDQKRLERARFEFSRANSRYERTAKEEDQMEVAADQELFTEGSTRRTAFRDSLKDKLQEENISNLRSAAYHGHLDYTDAQGNKHKIDVKNIGGFTADGELMKYEMEDDGLTPKLDGSGNKIPIKGVENSLSAAFLNYNKAYDKAMADYNKTDATQAQKDAALARANDAKLKAQAIATELLDAGGDNGQTAVGRALKSLKFDDSGNPLGRELTGSVDEMSKFITRNGKWIAQIKRTDNGLFRMLNDAANSAVEFKTRMNYATGGDQKITAELIPDFSDGYLGGVTYEIKQGTYDNDAKAAGRLLELDEAVQRAMADPRIANRIKPETMKFLQTIHQKAYELQQKQWLEAKDSAGNLEHISELSGYADDGNGNMVPVQAEGIDADGELIRQIRNSSGQVIGTEKLHASASASSPALKAKDAYSKQIRQATELVRDKTQDGEVKIIRKRSMPSNIEIDPARNIYRMKLSDGSYRDLTPDEQRVVDKIIDYNASVDLQNQGD